MEDQYFQDLRFFPNTPGHSTGLTPFLNGSIQDVNLFDAQYASHRDSMSSTSKSGSDTTSNIQLYGSSADHDAFRRSKSTSTPPDNDAMENLHKQTEKRRSADGFMEFEPDMSGTGNSHKRVKFLERNRLAAAKCRTKKKEWTNNLEAAARQASQQTRELQAIVQNLRDEVLHYKTQLMTHQGCECHDIRQYLMNEQAKGFAVYDELHQPRRSSE